MSSSTMLLILIAALLVDVMESITHQATFTLVTTNIAPIRLGPPWQDSSYLSCIVSCRETYPTCQSVMFHPDTGKCTPGSTLAATSPLPSPDEGAVYVSVDPSSPTLMSSTLAYIWSTSVTANSTVQSTMADISTPITSATNSAASTTAPTTRASTTALNITAPITAASNTASSTTATTAAQSTTSNSMASSTNAILTTTNANTTSTTTISTTVITTDSSTPISCTAAGLAYHVYNNVTYCIGLFNIFVSYTEHVTKCYARSSKTVRVTTADKLQMLHTISGGSDFWIGCLGTFNYPYVWEESNQNLTNSEYNLLFPPLEKDKTFNGGSCCMYSASNRSAYVMDCTELAFYACEL